MHDHSDIADQIKGRFINHVIYVFAAKPRLRDFLGKVQIALLYESFLSISKGEHCIF